MKIKALAALFVAMSVVVMTANVAASKGSKVRVDDVGTARVERLMVWSLEADVPPEAIVAPPTCAPDPGDRGDKVWFLPVFLNSGAAEVTCAVPARSSLVLNLGGAICLEDEVTHRGTLVDSAIQGEIDLPSVQTVVVDGKDTDEFASEPTREFEATLPDGSVFGVPGGVYAFGYSGRNLLIQGLGKGEHTIRLIFRLPPDPDPANNFDVDVTYHVTIGN